MASWPPVQRLLVPPTRTFFLFGPRSVGKSFWLAHHFPRAPTFNLLDNRLYLELSRDPSLLEAKIGTAPRNAWIGIDEVQKVPQILDEVHRLIDKKGYRFVLTGSSARKLKRGGADLLAGRALTKHMEGFSFPELGKRFHLHRAVEWGTLPLVVNAMEDAKDILSAYVHTYIREEIKEEGIVRKAEPFLRFLEVAGLMNGQTLNKENIARDAHVPRSSVDLYFSILEDTLVGHFLPAFRPRAKVREQSHPKFYWFDPGVARGAAGYLHDPADALWLGRAFETYLFHELRVYNHTAGKHRAISYYRTGGGQEIDFVIETRKATATTKSHIICIEAKWARKWQRSWESAMRGLAASDAVVVDKMIGVYTGAERYHFDGIDVLPAAQFLETLFNGTLF